MSKPVEHIFAPPSDDGQARRQGDTYEVTEDAKAFFLQNGYLVLRGVVAPSELTALDDVFDSFARGAVPGMGKDFCDMSGSLDRKPEDFTLINAMLPRVYLPKFANNIYERRAQTIARALRGADMTLDYDQFLLRLSVDVDRDPSTYGRVRLLP